MMADLKKEKCPGGFGPSTHGKNYVVIINNYMIKKKKNVL